MTSFNFQHLDLTLQCCWKNTIPRSHCTKLSNSQISTGRTSKCLVSSTPLPSKSSSRTGYEISQNWRLGTSHYFSPGFGGEGISPINCQWEGRSIRILQSLKGESDKFYGDTNEILRPTRPPVTNNDRSLRLY